VGAIEWVYRSNWKNVSLPPFSYSPFQLPSASSVTGPPAGTLLMSTISMFGTAGSEVSCGVEIHSSARCGRFGSCHRYISCGLTASPAAEVGT